MRYRATRRSRTVRGGRAGVGCRAAVRGRAGRCGSGRPSSGGGGVAGARAGPRPRRRGPGCQGWGCGSRRPSPSSVCVSATKSTIDKLLASDEHSRPRCWRRGEAVCARHGAGAGQPHTSAVMHKNLPRFRAARVVSRRIVRVRLGFGLGRLADRTKRRALGRSGAQRYGLGRVGGHRR